jgi:hypothetical protein
MPGEHFFLKHDKFVMSFNLPKPILANALLLLVFAWIPICLNASDPKSGQLPAQKTDFHLYLLAGQSNMAGRGKVGQVATISNPRILMLNRQGQWVTAADPLHFDKPGAGVGLGLSFAQAMLADAPPGVVIGLIPCAAGGSGIDDWQEGKYFAPTRSRLWEDTLQRVLLAQKSGALKGILWHQGESDSAPENTATYKAKLARLVANFRKNFAEPEVPFVAGEILPRSNNDKNLNKVLHEAKNEIPLYDVATVEELGPNSAKDSVHLNAKSQRIFGVRYAEKVKLLQTKAVGTGTTTAGTGTTTVVPGSTVSKGKIPRYKKLILSKEFLAEGSHYGDFNKDGIPDVVAGPYWFEGPDFTKKHEIYPYASFDPEKYSDNFTSFGVDLNGDGWDDVFICPHPGTQGYWYENPKGAGGHWKKHMFANEIGNESPAWKEIIKGAGKGLLYNRNGYIGFSTCKIKENKPEWTFHPVSAKDTRRFERYTHGIGSGDINGDGRVDIVEKEGWWEQPENPQITPWPFHKHKFSMAGAHMHIFDVDGDGLNDVVTAWHSHLYGLIWWKQVRDAQGNISWVKNELLPGKPDLDSPALRISQMHAMDVADFNGDGLPDLVTGKRFWAHGSIGDREANAPAVLYWFELSRDGKGGATFIPHKIDDDSGVGTQVTAVDLNGDKVPDIICASKKGVFLFLSEK